MKTILITSALPYANGPLHLGHILEGIQTDIWARFQRLQGHRCFYVCADDAHGTAIMLKADQLKISPEELVAKVNAEHRRDFGDFLINFDNYSSTHSKKNRRLSENFYHGCVDAKLIFERDVKRAYDPEKKMFLADRFITGACPLCKAPEQYGDTCEACGATYDISELIDPRSTLSGATLENKNSRHVFLDLPASKEVLVDWLNSAALQNAVRNKLHEWINTGLKPWNISRDAPYFGFTIPGYENKYFYVWLDAPLGYIASCEELCERLGLNLSEFFGPEASIELHHVIGKDIINFHGLFWPALLHAVGWKKPKALHVHGFLTVEGAKMSKSRGTFITARDYLDKLDPQYWRYYLACKLNNKVEDIDFNRQDFVSRINTDLVGKTVNIASRCARFINRDFDCLMAPNDSDAELRKQFVDRAEVIGAAYQAFEYSRAMREIIALADLANQYIETQKPWVLAKKDRQDKRVQGICSTGLNLYRLLILYLQPVLPQLAKDSERLLNCQLDSWAKKDQWLGEHKIAQFEPLLNRVPEERVAQL